MIYIKQITVIFICLATLICFGKKLFLSRFETSNKMPAFFCTAQPCFDNHLLRLFYTSEELSLKKQIAPCLLIFEMQKLNQKKAFLPDEVFQKLINDRCTAPGPDLFHMKQKNEHFVLHRMGDGKSFCQTPLRCPNIIFESPDLFIIQWQNQDIQSFISEKPYVWRKQLLSVSPFFLDRNFDPALFEKHVELRMRGGLGNQLFEYWTAKVYALKRNKKLSIQNKKAYSLFQVLRLPEQDSAHEPFAFSAQSNAIRLFYAKNTASSDHELPPHPDSNYVFLDGFLQSYKNFEGYEEYIRKHTVFKKDPSFKNQAVIKKMHQQNSILIHVRRGDYLTNGYTILTPDYYKRAVSYMNSHVKNPHYYIFSNDMRWAKENLNLKEPHTFVDWNRKDYEDLQLMMHCKHFIIANSTFSWWGAFLSQNPDKIVIVPDLWLPAKPLWQEHLIMPGWIRQKIE